MLSLKPLLLEPQWLLKPNCCFLSWNLCRSQNSFLGGSNMALGLPHFSPTKLPVLPSAWLEKGSYTCVSLSVRKCQLIIDGIPCYVHPYSSFLLITDSVYISHPPFHFSFSLSFPDLYFLFSNILTFIGLKKANEGMWVWGCSSMEWFI